MRLKELREGNKETQQQLSMILNVSQTMISRYELGIAYPEIETLIAMAQHYHVSVDYLLGVSESKLPYSRSDLSQKEQEMLFLFKRLDSAHKDKAMAYIQGMLDD